MAGKEITLILPKYNKGMYGFPAPPMPVLYLASVTPKQYKVKVIDERVEEVRYNKTDMVGISVKTCTAKRAYEIASNYRKMGIKVVLGGVHVSALPDEALKHADSVVIGEADSVWETVLEDFEKGRLKRKYVGQRISNFASVDFSYVNLKKYLIKNVVQTSRGCPMGCEFCTPSSFNGKKIRHRQVDEVIAEIRSMNPKEIFYFSDDNLIGDKEYAQELFQRLIPLNIKWACQANINIAESSLLDLAYKAGCRLLWIGFESIDQGNLDDLNKGYIIKDYSQSIRKIRGKGIVILGSFVFGLDHDTKEAFSLTYNFCLRNKIDFANFLPLMPRPGTPLFDKLEKEKRILHKDWSKFEGLNIVYQPKNISAKELRKNIIKINRQFYSYPNIFKRTFGYLGKHSFKSVLLLFIMNVGYKRNAYYRERLSR